MNLVDMLVKNSRMYPDHVAFVEVRPLSKKRSEISWKEFDHQTSRLANALLEKGIGKEDKIFLLGKNSIDWIEAYFAVIKTGAWVVPLNFRFTNDDILFCAKVAEPSVFIMDEEYGERVNSIRSDLRTVRDYISVGDDTPEGMENMTSCFQRSSSELPGVFIQGDDVAGLYFTSGTTGAPKPVMMTHRNLMCAAVSEAVNHELKHSDSFLMMPPLYHLAISHLLGVMLAGGRAILLIEEISPQFIIETMSGERISEVFLLVPWALDILEALDSGRIRKEDYDLNSLRLTHMGAQPIPPSVVKRLKAYFPDMAYDTNFGLSESAGPGILHLGVENERKVGAIGKACLMWDVRIVDPDGKDVLQGGVGEIIVKGDGVMKGYYKNPELTAETIRDGWLYTGDLGKMDDEGFIYLVDRKKDLVITGGENIYPVEVEAVILRHEKVHDVGVIGIPDERLGEIAAAVIQVVPGQDLGEDEIASFCEKELPRYKCPRRIIFDDVPRNPTGKIEKPKLRKRYAEGEID